MGGVAHVVDTDALESEDAARRLVARTGWFRLILVHRDEQEVLPHGDVTLPAVALDGGQHARVARIRDVEDPEARVAPLVDEVYPERQVGVRGPGIPGEGDVAHVRAVDVWGPGGGGRCGGSDHRGEQYGGNREANDGAHGRHLLRDVLAQGRGHGHTRPKQGQTIA